MTKVFTNIPFFRILIPFVTGILITIYFNLNQVTIFFFIILLMVAFGLFLIKKQSSYTKMLFIICLDIFFFFLAVNLVNTANLISQKIYYGNYIKNDSYSYIIATINDLPIKRETFTKCQLKVSEIKSGAIYQKAQGTFIGYFKNLQLKEKLMPGKTLLIKAKLLEIDTPKNPDEFDYKSYLYNKHIYHTAFIENNAFKILDVPLQLNLVWYKGLVIKNYILQKLKTSNLSYTAYTICAALLTGYDDEINKQVIEAFSHSGTLHVLSVSGLHTGLIYLVLSFLVDVIDRKKKFKFFKFFLITFLLWSFALITGFSAPVLRAVIMFNLLGFGKIFFRSSSRNQINILLVSAFILLCYDPYLIKDIGFLLSYFAVFGLLYFQPKFLLLWQPTNFFINKIWQGTTVSLAATTSTLPLTLFYFKQFPIWFFICNLFVIPISFIVLMLSLLIVINVSPAAYIINWLIDWLISFIAFFNDAKFGFIDNIDFRFIDACLLSLIIIFFSITIQEKSYRTAISTFLLLIFWQILCILLSNKIKNESILTVYQINKSNTVSVKLKTHVVINKLDSTNFLYHVKPQIVAFNNASLKISEFNYVEKNNQKILILKKPNYLPIKFLKQINYLVLANNFSLADSDFVKFNKLKAIIIDGSNNNSSIKKTEELCRKFGVELIETKQTGAFILNLQ